MRTFGWILIVLGVASIWMGIAGFETEKATGDATLVTRGWLRAAIEKKPETEIIYHTKTVEADAGDRFGQAAFGVGLLIGGLYVLGKHPKKTATN